MEKIKAFILPVLIGMIFMVCCMPAKASEFSFPDPKTVNVEGCEKKFVQFYDGGYILYLSKDVPTKTYASAINPQWGCGTPLYYCELLNGVWTVPTATANGRYFGTSPEIIYSNFNWIAPDGTVFFPVTVSPLQAVVQGINLRVLTQEKILGQIAGLMPLLILYLVGLVGFWKALSLLWRVLRKA